MSRASDGGWYRQKRCTSKKAFPSKAATEPAIYAFKMQFGSILFPYHCSYCRQWHVGHRRPKRR